MEMHVMTLEIKAKDTSGNALIFIKSLNQKAGISYNESSREIIYHDKNSLSEFIQNNEKQFRKILHAKRSSILRPDFQLKFALCDKKDVEAFNDINNIIGLDKRGDQAESYVVKHPMDGIAEIFTDGSFLKKQGGGGYVVLIKYPAEDYHLRTLTTSQKSSSLIELLAAIKGLEILQDEKKLRIVTDSQYVRKGITEWIFYWKLNGWHTANGKTVRNQAYWKKFDQLTNSKYIEFQWVKSHSGHFENTICDLYAKETANRASE